MTDIKRVHWNRQFRISRDLVIEIIAFLCILLFVYAAMNKLSDVQKFRVQIGQSPLLTPIAGFAAWAVPFSEIVIALLLIFQQTRFIGFFSFFGMMMMFSAYIIAIVNYSPYLPCRCGGVIDKLSWNQHLVFNLAFIILPATAIFMRRPQVPAKKPISTLKITVPILFGISLCAVLLVYGLYTQYDQPNSKPNGFDRNIREIVAAETQSLGLPSDRYYLAGLDDSTIYLGNYDQKLHMLIADLTLTDTQDVRLSIRDMDRYKLTDISLSVQPPSFYLWNGTLPINFRGNLKDLTADRFMSNKSYFTKLLPLNEHSFFMSLVLDTIHGQILGKETSDGSLEYRKDLLEKQQDGLFSVDGTMNYDSSNQQFVYLYFYRNQFLVADSNLNLRYRASTIDTNRHVKLQVAQIMSEKSNTLSAPPVQVNRNSSVCGGMLYVLANLMADNENRSRFRRSSVVDVYELEKGGYQYSFYLPLKTINEFKVINNRLVALAGKQLIIYKLNEVTIRKDIMHVATGDLAEHPQKKVGRNEQIF